MPGTINNKLHLYETIKIKYLRAKFHNYYNVLFPSAPTCIIKWNNISTLLYSYLSTNVNNQDCSVAPRIDVNK